MASATKDETARPRTIISLVGPLLQALTLCMACVASNESTMRETLRGTHVTILTVSVAALHVGY